MPIYEYKCPKCGFNLEKFYKTYKEGEKEQFCPKCGIKMEKLISISNFQFKGSGWYSTDYKNKSIDKE